MEKGKIKSNSILKILAILFVCIFCSCFLVGCIGTMGGSSGSSGSSGGGSSSGGSSGDDTDSDDGPYNEEDIKNSVSNYNDVFLGAIGVYDIDNEKVAFIDNYTRAPVNFNYLIDRQFNTLATIIFDSLNYAYGTGEFSGSLSNYHASGHTTINLKYTSDSLIEEIVYNESDSLKYANAMNGGYELVMTTTDNVSTFEYSSTLLSDRKWSKVLTSKDDLVGALKYIYLNCQKPSSNSTSLNFNDSSLKNYYKSFSKALDENTDISYIGLSQDYMWNVLYYLAYSVIGETNIQNSIDSASHVFNGTYLRAVTSSNYEYFEKYKAYEKILINIVDNAFRLVINDRTAEVSDNYCFSGVDWNTTLYPNLVRNEYIFFDDLDDICDAEGDDTNVDTGWDPDNFVPDPDYNPSYDPDEEWEEEPIISKVGSLRRLKQIILLPNINKEVHQDTSFTFSVSGFCISFATPESDEYRLEVYTSAVTNSSDVITNKQVKFDNGESFLTMEDGTTIETKRDGTTTTIYPDGTIVVKDIKKGTITTTYPDKTNKEEEIDEEKLRLPENVADDGSYLIIDEKASNSGTADTAIMAGANIFNSKTESAEEKAFVFGSIENADSIREQFTEDYYTVTTTNELMVVGMMNVCNNIFLVNNGESVLNISKNYIRFDFEYLSSNGKALSEIPETYLMVFDIL